MNTRITDAKEIPGHGICVKVDGRTVLAGNDRLMKQENIAYKPCPAVGTVVYLAEEGSFLGAILISDVIKRAFLRQSGILKGPVQPGL